MIKKFIMLFSILLLNSLEAKIEDDLKNFFDKIGMNSNINSPGVYQDQAAGYYTGGSLVARNTVRNAQIMNIQMPGSRSGCGGIDAWTGGFSHITAQALIDMLKSIGSNAASYAFMLALQTISPQIYNLVNELNALATKINNLNINSCEVAATMLGGVWPKSDQSSKHLCQAMGTDLGAFSDWAAARQGCGAKGQRENVLGRKNSDPRYKDLLVGEFNLTWQALLKNDFLNKPEDQDLAELFMTLVGSIITKKSEEVKGKAVQGNSGKTTPNDNAYRTIVLPGVSDKEEVLSALLNGGQTKIYKCDSTECLNPQLTDTNFNVDNGLLIKVHSTLESLIDKIYKDEAISPAEKDFLNSTRLPIYKMLNVITAYTKSSSPLNLHHYGDLIAIDLLYKYVIEVIDLVQDSIAQLRAAQVNDLDVERFLKQLKIARDRITTRRTSAFQQMDNILSFIESTQLIEKQLHFMLGGVANEHNWF